MDVSEDTNCGLYNKDQPWLNKIDEHCMSKIDPEQVNLNLAKTVEHGYKYHTLKKRAMKTFTQKACVQGGEVRFQKYSEWNHNNYYGIMYRWLFELKYFEKYESGMALQMFLLWVHFTPFLFSGHVRTACHAIISNIR